MAHYLIKDQEEHYDRWGIILGTAWDKERVDAFTAPAAANIQKMNKFSIPLAYLIRPELKEMLKPKITVGDMTVDEDAVESLADLPKEEFLKRMRTNNWSKSK